MDSGAWQDTVNTDVFWVHGQLTLKEALQAPQTEEPSRLQRMESQRVGHDWETNTTWVNTLSYFFLKNKTAGFLGGTVVKNPPANAGDARD